MLVHIPADTVDDDDLEEMMLNAIEAYSAELSGRIRLCLDTPTDDWNEDDYAPDDAAEAPQGEKVYERQDVVDGEDEEEEEEEEEDEDGEDEEDDLDERHLTISADGMRPDETQTVVALIKMVIEETRFGICGEVLEDAYDDESGELLDEEEEDEGEWGTQED